LSENQTLNVRFAYQRYKPREAPVIVGIGTDICMVDRIAGAIDRQGQRLVDRLFLGNEQQYAMAKARPEGIFAVAFAVKEACAKALGTGITERVRWTDIEVLDIGPGSARVVLGGGAARRLRRLSGSALIVAPYVSLSISNDYVAAFVQLEAT
jgi:holo-[acyl-carrier protein] synthase